MMPAKVFSLAEILSIFSSSSAYNKLIDEIQRGFINYSNKVVYVAPVIHLGSTDKNGDIPQMIGSGDVCLKSGYIVKDKYYVIKIAGGGFKNPENGRNFPNSGTMLVFSQLTGALNGILMDNGILTELRTATASALARNISHQNESQILVLLEQEFKDVFNWICYNISFHLKQIKI